MNEKIINQAINYTANAGLSCLLAAGIFYAVDFKTRHCTGQIYSQAQLERIVQEEREKIGVPKSVIIESTLDELKKEMPKIPAYGERKGKNKYYLHFDDTTGNSKGVVRHELCHIYYQDFSRRLTNWREWIPYLLIEEPRAIWCSIDF